MCDQDQLEKDRQESEALGLVTRKQFGIMLGVAMMVPRVANAVAVAEPEVRVSTSSRFETRGQMTSKERTMQVNVLLDNGVFKYSVGTTPPTYTTFVHHFNVNDQITWSYWQSNQRVQVAFETDTCPFADLNNNPWPDKTATFPNQPSKLYSGFNLGRKYSRIKYTVTLLDAPGTPKDDPEVIVVNG
jgi:hypothetical protein